MGRNRFMGYNDIDRAKALKDRAARKVVLMGEVRAKALKNKLKSEGKYTYETGKCSKCDGSDFSFDDDNEPASATCNNCGDSYYVEMA